MKSIHDFRTSRTGLGRLILAVGLTTTLFSCRDAVAPITPSDNQSEIGALSAGFQGEPSSSATPSALSNRHQATGLSARTCST